MKRNRSAGYGGQEDAGNKAVVMQEMRSAVNALDTPTVRQLYDAHKEIFQHNISLKPYLAIIDNDEVEIQKFLDSADKGWTYPRLFLLSMQGEHFQKIGHLFINNGKVKTFLNSHPLLNFFIGLSLETDGSHIRVASNQLFLSAFRSPAMKELLLQSMRNEIKVEKKNINIIVKWACENGHLNVLSSLEKDEKISLEDHYFLIQKAPEDEQIKILQLFLHKFIEGGENKLANIPHYIYHSMMRHAAIHGHRKVLAFLLEHKNPISQMSAHNGRVIQYLNGRLRPPLSAPAVATLCVDAVQGNVEAIKRSSKKDPVLHPLPFFLAASCGELGVVKLVDDDTNARLATQLDAEGQLFGAMVPPTPLQSPFQLIHFQAMLFGHAALYGQKNVVAWLKPSISHEVAIPMLYWSIQEDPRLMKGILLTVFMEEYPSFQAAPERCGMSFACEEEMAVEEDSCNHPVGFQYNQQFLRQTEATNNKMQMCSARVALLRCLSDEARSSGWKIERGDDYDGPDLSIESEQLLELHQRWKELGRPLSELQLFIDAAYTKEIGVLREVSKQFHFFSLPYELQGNILRHLHFLPPYYQGDVNFFCAAVFATSPEIHGGKPMALAEKLVLYGENCFKLQSAPAPH